MILGYMGGPSVITSVLIRGSQGEISPRSDHRRRNWSDVATSQGSPAATGSWKRQRTDYPLEPLGGAQPS